MKSLFIIIAIFLSLASFANSSYRSNYNNLVIELSAIVDDVGNIDMNIDSVIRKYRYKGQDVSIVSFAPADSRREAIMKNQFFISKIYYDKKAINKILSSKKKTEIYAQSDEMISLLEKNDIGYIQVLNNVSDASKIEKEHLLYVENKYGKPLLIANDIKEIIGIKVDKDKIFILDGDTIIYNDMKYRILGVDAPEMEQTPHGDIAKSFVKNKIDNANDIYINVCSRDIYNRVLAHIFIDNENLSFMLLTNRLAIQNVTTYGDNGFEEVASAILHYSKNNRKRLPFKSPAVFRKENRKLYSEEEEE